MAGKRGGLNGMVIVALLMLGFALKGVLIEPPSLPTHVSPGQFDTGRAIARLRRILGDERPHPVDSDADDAVRGRLIAELRSIGLQPQVQEALDCSDFPKTRIVSCSRVRNVIATTPGQADGRHLLLNAHYDSTPTGPGAGDDGVGVATLLEVGALLKAEPPKRPVTLLFNEGEEVGLNGSSAFVRSPLAQQVDSLINIDTRGVTGPALMYETNEPNGAALAAYATATSRPYANSLSTDFARLIPNTTDVVEFKPMRWTILNFGIIGNETRYHSPGDTVAALDRATMHHVGSEVLALTRTLADAPPLASGARSVFTDVAGRIFIHLPLILAAALLALLIAIAVLLARREKALTKPLAMTAGTFVGGIAASAFVAFLATLARPGDFWRAYPLVAYLAVYAVLVAAMVAIWARWGAPLERNRARAASWLFILLIGGTASLALPGAIIFFLAAPAVALTGIAVQRQSPRTGELLAIIAILIQFLMFGEFLAALEMLLIDGPLWAVAPLAAMIVLPVLAETGDAPLRPALATMLLGSLGLWIAALVLPRASAERPGVFGIDYFRDADRNKASWGIASKEAPLPKAIAGGWHSGTLPYNSRARWIVDAPLLQTPVPSARLIASQPEGAGRRVRIALSPGGANAITMRFAESTRLLELGLPAAAETLPLKAEPAKAMLRCSGRSCEGFVIEALLADRKSIIAELFAYRWGLPPQGGPLIAARPKNAIPQYAPDTTVTMKRVKF